MLCRGDRPVPLRAPFHGLYPLLTGIFSKVHEGECQPLGTEPAGKEAWERGLGPGETHPILPADPGNRAVKLGGPCRVCPLGWKQRTGEDPESVWMPWRIQEVRKGKPRGP